MGGIQSSWVPETDSSIMASSQAVLPFGCNGATVVSAEEKAVIIEWPNAFSMLRSRRRYCGALPQVKVKEYIIQLSSRDFSPSAN